MHPLRFSVSIDAERHQYADGGPREIHAVLTAEASGAAGGGLNPADLGVIIAVDYAPGRLTETRQAAAAAIDAVPDGIAFALLRGGQSPGLCYPYSGHWAVAEGTERRMARFEAERLIPGSSGPGASTSYAGWLELAREHFAGDPRPVQHLLMLTDGSGTGRTGDKQLEEALRSCAGRMTCDVLGLGDRWDPAELSRVATRLHGTAAQVRDPGQLDAWLRRMFGALLAAREPAAELEVRLRTGVGLHSLREVAPVRRELIAAPGQEAARRVFSTHLWTAETRQYELVLDASPEGDPLEEQLQLARVSLGSAAEPVLVRWSYAPGAAGARPPASVTYHHQRSELVAAYNEGCDALSREDWPAAERKLGEAARIAYALGDTGFLDDQLGALAQVLDPAAGRVRVLRKLERTVVLAARFSMQHAPAFTGPQEQPSVSCPAGCGRLSAPAARYCVRCGSPL